MQTNELKPCPFCGCQAEVTKWQEGWFVECKAQRCGGTIGAYKTEAEAIEAWNTRADRTCKMIEEHDWNDEWEPYGIFCSECDEAVFGWKSDYGYPIPKYCPNCGAKVIHDAD